MSKSDINKILLVNDYIILCKSNSLDKKISITQKYMTCKIQKVLTEKEKINFYPIKTFFSLMINFLIFR